MLKPIDVLKKYWGYTQFRPLQEDIIQAVLEGRDTLALLPTGGGKSVCFQVPALCKPGICIVISPLIALMKDQVQNLQQRQGIPAEAIYTGMSYKEIDRRFDRCIHGDVRFLYLSPERLFTELAQARIQQMQVNLIAIDEAHCISQWGYDFRPPYLEIAQLREWLPKVPIIALTATATPTVVEDIQEKLAFKANKAVFQKSFARDNLAYVVLHEEQKLPKLLEILQKIQGTAVVYARNRRQTQEIAQFLQKRRISADYYHAGLNNTLRSEKQERWMRGQIRVIVATNAFGMGIDKPDVRVVVHLTLPDSLEAYFQEAGRGGRDGKKAFAVLLYHNQDQKQLWSQYEIAYPEIATIRKVYQALGNYFQLAIGAGAGASYDFDLIEFAQRYRLKPLEALHALKVLQQAGWIALTEAVFTPARLQVIVSKEGLYDFLLSQRNPKIEKLLRGILRSAQGAFQHPVQIKETALANSLNVSVNTLQHMLQNLQQQQIIQYAPQKDKPQLVFIHERADTKNLQIDQALYHFLKTRQKANIEAAIAYAETVRCRSQLLLAYFGETQAPTCGKCDVCLGRTVSKNTSQSEIQTQIRTELQQKIHTPDTLRQVFSSLHQEALAQALQFLQNQGKIALNEKGQLQWLK